MKKVKHSIKPFIHSLSYETLFNNCELLIFTPFSLTDVAEKSAIMKKNKAFMIASLQKDESLTLNGMIDEEIAL